MQVFAILRLVLTSHGVWIRALAQMPATSQIEAIKENGELFQVGVVWIRARRPFSPISFLCV